MQQNSHFRKALSWDALIATGICSLTLTIYLLTITPSLSYLSPDGSELATIPAILGLAHSPGYPIYTWLGYLFSLLPFRDVAFRINLMSAVMAAIAAGGLYLIGLRLLPEELLPDRKVDLAMRRMIGTGASFVLAFSPTFWSQALIAEVYTSNAAFIVITLLLLLRWERTQKTLDFFWFALILGLSSGMHISTLGFGLGMAVFILLTNWRVIIRWRWWLAALTGFGLGIAQYAWLPLAASTLNDTQMLRSAPTTWQGIYNYTLGAFSQMRFAFSVGELPGRLVLYFSMLIDELGWLFLIFGLIGLFALVLRRPRHFFLLAGMYLVHIWFFMQYSVFDLNVFYIPVHLIWCLFAMFGILEMLVLLSKAWRRLSLKWQTGHQRAQQSAQRLLCGICAAALFVPAAWQVAANWQQNDYSQDTAINDFYANVWQLLPEGSALLTDSGVFGYDAFYWQLVYKIRPDVLLPALEAKNLNTAAIQGKQLYSTADGFSTRGPGALPAPMQNLAEWQIAVLFGETPSITAMGRSQLVLYYLSDDPPDVSAEGTEADLVTHGKINGFSLQGVTIKQTSVESGGYIELWLYWLLPEGATAEQRAGITLQMNGRMLISTTVGLGLLSQLRQEGLAKSGELLVDKLRVVVPSTIEAGPAALTLIDASGQQRVTLGEIMIVNELSEVEAWLQNAGR